MLYPVQRLESQAEQSIEQLESPYFHYLRELLAVWNSCLATMSVLDINFRISQSETGKLLKGLFREVVAKKLVFSKCCSRHTVEVLKQFMERTLPEYSDSLEEASVQPEFEKNVAWSFEAQHTLRRLVEMLYDVSPSAERTSSRLAGPGADIAALSSDTAFGNQMVWSVSEQFSRLSTVLRDSEVAQDVAILHSEHQAREVSPGLSITQLRQPPRD